MAFTTFITGASSGIGLALAKACLDRGGSVAAISRRKPELSSDRFHWRSLDLSAIERIRPSVAELLSGVAAIDLVILNAGILGPLGDLSTTPLPKIKEVMDVNVWANKELLDALFASRIPIKQVVAISSGAAMRAQRGWNAYSLSKAALNMLIGLYAEEKLETHFSAFAPGIIDTGMQEQISSLPGGDAFASFERLKTARGTGAMPKAEDAAELLLDGMERALEYPSGSFLDIREMG
jgi:NAD(P)-dependent dehydrogenase (short-subunit alcohol dehydrogenase family)